MLTGFRKATGKCLGHVTCRLLQCSRSALLLCCAHSSFRLRVGEFPDHKWSRHSSAGQPQPCSREWGSCLHSHAVFLPAARDWEECCNCLYSLASASVWLLAPAPSQQHGGGWRIWAQLPVLAGYVGSVTVTSTCSSVFGGASQLFHHYSWCPQIRKWISLIYSLGAFQTALFSLGL